MPMRLRMLMPEFHGATEWVNGMAVSPGLAGGPVLVHFWAASCLSCQARLPLINEWRKQYAEKFHLHIIGIHVPRTDLDKEAATVKAAVIQHKMEYPVAIDNEFMLAGVFQNSCVPAYYLFDRNLQLRHFQTGERGIDILKPRLYKLMDMHHGT